MVVAGLLLPMNLFSQTPEPTGWKLVWQDEFDHPGLPDSTHWDYEVGRVRNQEAQYFTKARTENAEVKDGHLILTARKEKFEGAEYTSASLHTRGKFDLTYGRIEIRAKIPGGLGTWPALWTLGKDIGKSGWPLCGEIDLLENVGWDPLKAHFTVHTAAYNHVKKTQKGTHAIIPDYARDFHLYALEWNKEKLVWFMDGKQVHEFVNDGKGDPATWPFDQPQYLIINLAIGGTWGGAKGIDDTIFPCQFLVDYVRIYQKP